MILYEQHLATVRIKNPPPRGSGCQQNQGERACLLHSYTYIVYIGFVTDGYSAKTTLFLHRLRRMYFPGGLHWLEKQVFIPAEDIKIMIVTEWCSFCKLWSNRHKAGYDCMATKCEIKWHCTIPQVASLIMLRPVKMLSWRLQDGTSNHDELIFYIQSMSSPKTNIENFWQFLLDEDMKR